MPILDTPYKGDRYEVVDATSHYSITAEIDGKPVDKSRPTWGILDLEGEYVAFVSNEDTAVRVCKALDVVAAFTTGLSVENLREFAEHELFFAGKPTNKSEHRWVKYLKDVMELTDDYVLAQETGS